VTIAKGEAATAHGLKYLQQLCKHWSHKFEVELGEARGTIHFPAATATLEARAEGLQVVIAADEEATVERMTGVVASHLDRFAFREAPLAFHWSA
jgi:hypothetical protein